jgi:hypothetical protein
MTIMQTSSSRSTPTRNTLRRLGIALTLTASVFAGAFVPVPAVAAAADASWDVDTVDGTFGSGRQNYDYAVKPGDRLDDALVVVNNGTTPIDLVLYSADAFTTETGQLDLRTRDHVSTGAGEWLRLDRDRITLQPGESGEIPFTATVPADAAPGDHLGGVVTASASTASGTEPERRVAIRVHFRVGDGFAPSLSVEDLRVDYAGDPFSAGDAIVTYTVRNSGDTTLAAEQSIAVAGPFGSFRVTADPVDDTPSLLPGEGWRVSVPIRGVAPSGLLTATVAVVPLYTDPAGSTGPLAVLEHTGSGWAIPWLPLLLVFVLVVALVGVVFARRFRRPLAGSTRRVSEGAR